MRPVVEMRHSGNYEEFSCSFQCYNENEDCEEEIVEQIAVKHQKSSEDEEISKDDSNQHERMTNQYSRKFVALL
jgi:hypothetical protein